MTESAIDPQVEIAARKKATDEFSIARSEAINEYARLESHLAMIFEAISGAEIQKAYAMFASFATNQARMSTLKQLLNLTHAEKYDNFFESLSVHLMGIGSTRNKIVHWIMVHSHTGGREFNSERDIYLASHPDIFSNKQFYKHEIQDFTKKVGFFADLTFRFATHLKHPELSRGNPDLRPWQEIFIEKISYPPPSNHPYQIK
ncbi:MAG: hypothetical protein E5Y88_22335 [Mesorhizobium sp.]|uniref:hypothetical protein n=1 Tax=Mesorhizobium sp. TaxID=1871066 RepID=UPI00120E4BE0|nr:hypothetical protein [Mesorhizobium sp.]TIL23667.1 MAG: hypothetical protein E5Y88_22335 [Mesorhizobium sp.]